MISCLICDDHAMMRDALAGAVRLAHPQATVIEAGDFPTAWAAAAAGPDLILCDLVMPGAAPEAGILALQAVAPRTPILVVTGNEDDALLLRLARAGVAGLLSKSARTAVIGLAISRILDGGRHLPPRLAALIEAQPDLEAERSRRVRLSPRQVEILQAMARGQTNKEIARSFDLSPDTVKAHAAAAFLALGVTNRTEAAYRAREEGLI